MFKKFFVLFFIFSLSLIVCSNAMATIPQVAGGYQHTLAIKVDGTLWAWGWNNTGQLGDGTTIDKHSPVQTGTATNWTHVAAGYRHSLGIKADGTLSAWGYNYYGQLGDGTTTNRNSPVKIGVATDWAQVIAEQYFTLAIRTDGTLWAWGWNSYGKLGDGTTTDKHSPIQIGNDNNWAQVTAGSNYTIAVKTDGTLWAWGGNGGQLGDGTTTDKHSPVQIGFDTDLVQVESGFSHTLATKTDGTLWAWGWNSYGELGDGTTTNKFYPVQIDTATNWLRVAGGGFHSIAIKTDNTLWTWGRNNYGQLGNWTTTNSSFPIELVCTGDISISFSGISFNLPQPLHLGTSVKISAQVFNTGYYNALANVSFYYDQKDSSHLINTLSGVGINMDSSALAQTTWNIGYGLSIGYHNIIVEIAASNFFECDTSNNEAQTEVLIISTTSTTTTTTTMLSTTTTTTSSTTTTTIPPGGNTITLPGSGGTSYYTYVDIYCHLFQEGTTSSGFDTQRIYVSSSYCSYAGYYCPGYEYLYSGSVRFDISSLGFLTPGSYSARLSVYGIASGGGNELEVYDSTNYPQVDLGPLFTSQNAYWNSYYDYSIDVTTALENDLLVSDTSIKFHLDWNGYHGYDGESVCGGTPQFSSAASGPDAPKLIITTASPTLITLSYFNAKPSGKKVFLVWETKSEIDNLGFNIYRSETEDGEYVKINKKLIPAKGNGIKGASYKLSDKNVKPGRTYYYKLEDIDRNGTNTLHGPKSAKVSFKKK